MGPLRCSTVLLSTHGVAPLNRLFAFFIAMLPGAVLAGPGVSISIPEPGDAALFVVAVIGLIVGRHISRRPPSHDEDEPQA